MEYSANDFALRLNTDGSLTYQDGASSAERFRINAGGNVGIGTANPGFKLDVVGRMRVKQATNSDTNTAGIWFNQIGPGNDQAFVGMLDDTHVGFFGNTGAGWGLTMNTTDGSVGIGTTPSNAKLDVKADLGSGVKGEGPNGVAGYGSVSGVAGFGNSGDGGFFNTLEGAGVHAESFDGPAFYGSSQNGNLFEGYQGAAQSPVFRITNTGQARSDVGFTTPAADFAELVAADDPARLNAGGLEPGDVLVIDPETGKLRKSSQRYSALVAGIYSTKPGFLGNKGVVDVTTPQAVPLALIGVVPTKVSAENGAIRPGDLLTTSSIPGYAMKASPILVRGVKVYRTGTILGKALEPLKRGKGVIKVLVTLR